MLSSEQSKTVTYVFSKLMESENNGWSELDDLLEVLEYLSDSEVYREAEVLYSYHRNKKMGSPYDNEKTHLFILNILESVEAITDLYKETSSLHPKNRYILENYLGLSQMGQIIELSESNAI